MHDSKRSPRYIFWSLDRSPGVLLIISNAFNLINASSCERHVIIIYLFCQWLGGTRLSLVTYIYNTDPSIFMGTFWLAILLLGIKFNKISFCWNGCNWYLAILWDLSCIHTLKAKSLLVLCIATKYPGTCTISHSINTLCSFRLFAFLWQSTWDSSYAFKYMYKHNSHED